MSTIKSLLESAHEISRWLEWESESLDDFHAYYLRFAQPGESVYRLVLEDALKFRGIRLDELRPRPVYQWICDPCQSQIIESPTMPTIPCETCGAQWWIRNRVEEVNPK